MQTAWLATYYPLQFYAAALTKAQANAIQTLVADIQKAGIKVLAIDINRSYEENVIEGDCIRLSMNKGKGIGGSAIGKILAARAEKPFESFLDFLERSNAGKTAIEPLIRLGAFKELPDCGTTKALLSFYEAYCADPKLKQKKNADKLSGLFWEKTSGTTLMDPIPDDFTMLEKIVIDNELMEFSLAGSPFEVLDRDKKIERASDILTSYKDFTESEDPYAMIPVLVKDFKEKPQKNGKMFAFVKFAAQTGEEWDSPCFANIWAHVKQKVVKGNILFVIFNHSEEDPENLLVGFPGWGQSKKSSEEAVTNVDDLLLDNIDLPAAKHML
jgi:DNA polymerase III alpha subunit